LHSELRRRAASRRALPCPSSYYYYYFFYFFLFYYYYFFIIIIIIIKRKKTRHVKIYLSVKNNIYVYVWSDMLYTLKKYNAERKKLAFKGKFTERPCKMISETNERGATANDSFLVC